MIYHVHNLVDNLCITAVSCMHYIAVSSCDSICNIVAFINDRQSLCRQHICLSMPDTTTACNSLHIPARTPTVHIYSNRQRTTIEPPFNMSFSVVPGAGNPYRSDFTAWHIGKNRHPAWCIVVHGHFILHC